MDMTEQLPHKKCCDRCGRYFEPMEFPANFPKVPEQTKCFNCIFFMLLHLDQYVKEAEQKE